MEPTALYLVTYLIHTPSETRTELDRGSLDIDALTALLGQLCLEAQSGVFTSGGARFACPFKTAGGGIGVEIHVISWTDIEPMADCA